MLKCPKNSKHDGFVQTVSQVVTRFIDNDGKQYTFPNQTVKTGKIFCVVCQAEAVEVENAKADTSHSAEC